MNTLYLGDCLNVLRESVPNESVDLVYIDPPFNSKRDYNIFFDDKEIQTQRIAFEDTWTLKNITTFGKKGADKGVDGLAQYLKDPKKQDVIKAAFQVKGGEHVESKDIDALLGAMDKHKCEIGVFLTIAQPTKPMLETVAGAGFMEIPGYKIPKLQILTLKDYFKNKLPKLPQVNITFKAAQLKGKKKQNQMKLDV